eukprot:COSAG01_NODE_1824_length_9141_cov_10.234461_1_plen_174_part_00
MRALSMVSWREVNVETESSISNLPATRGQLALQQQGGSGGLQQQGLRQGRGRAGAGLHTAQTTRDCPQPSRSCPSACHSSSPCRTAPWRTARRTPWPCTSRRRLVRGGSDAARCRARRPSCAGGGQRSLCLRITAFASSLPHTRQKRAREGAQQQRQSGVSYRSGRCERGLYS